MLIGKLKNVSVSKVPNKLLIVIRIENEVQHKFVLGVVNISRSMVE
jgi:hypothetical protein